MSAARIRQTRSAQAVYGIEWLLKAGTVAFMIAPVVLVIVLSFSAETVLAFPPESWGLRQYTALFGSDYWLSSIGESFMIAVPTALLAVAVGVPAALAIERSRLPGRSVLRMLGVAPLVLPGVAYAMALYTFYADLHLLGDVIGVILADTMLALPFVIIVVGMGLSRISPDLELVAMSLGATRLRATWGITLRLLSPSVAAAALLGFVIAFDEAVLVNFLGGGRVVTLPKAIFDSFRTGINPLITAIASLLMVVTGILMLGVSRLRKGTGT